MKGDIVYYPILPTPGQPGAERSDDVRMWVEKFMIQAGFASYDMDKTNAFLVASGDGGMMHGVRQNFDKNKVFVGINRGTRGFLLNPIDCINKVPRTFDQLRVVKLKLIKATFIQKNDKKKTFLAFNDIIVGGDIADTIYFDIKGSLEYFPNRRFSGNGVVVSTPQGATGFALKTRGTSALMGLNSDNWFVAGVATGPYPCDHVGPQVITINAKSRFPINGYADGRGQTVKNVKTVIIQPTDHEVQLGFLVNIDFEARRTQLAQMTERGEV